MCVCLWVPLGNYLSKIINQGLDAQCVSYCIHIHVGIHSILSLKRKYYLYTLERKISEKTETKTIKLSEKREKSLSAHGTASSSQKRHPPHINIECETSREMQHKMDLLEKNHNKVKFISGDQ